MAHVGEHVLPQGEELGRVVLILGGDLEPGLGELGEPTKDPLHAVLREAFVLQVLAYQAHRDARSQEPLARLLQLQAPSCQVQQQHNVGLFQSQCPLVLGPFLGTRPCLEPVGVLIEQGLHEIEARVDYDRDDVADLGHVESVLDLSPY